METTADSGMKSGTVDAGLDAGLLIQSGITYVQRPGAEVHPPIHELRPHQTSSPDLHLDLLNIILLRLERIQSTLDSTLDLISMPWYKRLHLWLKGVLGV